MKRNGMWVAALLLLCTMILGGCGKANTAQEKTFSYGTMAYGTAMENVGTNPHEAYTGWSTLRYGIGETLFRFDDRMEPMPWLAARDEQVDDNTVRIFIRDDVTFSNGRKVTGEAVKACLEDLVEKHDRAPKDLKMDRIEAEDQTVTIHCLEKVPALRNYLADPYACIIDMEAGEHDRIVVGTGPYVAERVTDTELDLVKNRNYWGGTKPKLDRIVVKSITDGDTLTMALQNGEIDAAQGLPYASLPLFRNAPEKFKMSQAETSRTYQAAFNFKTPALQDVRVRRAICMAVDKENFSKVLLHGNGVPAVGPFPGNLAYGDAAVKAPKYDLVGARTLLREAGYEDTDGDGYVEKDGKPLELRYLTYTSRQELPLLAEMLQASLKEIGVKLTVNATDNYRTFLKNGAFDIFSNAIVTAPTGDPEYYLSGHVLAGAVENKGGYENGRLSALAEQLHNTFGAADRAALAIQMEQQILDDCAILYAAHLRMTFVVKTGVMGFTAHPSDYYEITSELDKANE